MLKYITYFLARLCGPIRFGCASFVHANWDGTAAGRRITFPANERFKSSEESVQSRLLWPSITEKMKIKLLK